MKSNYTALTAFEAVCEMGASVHFDPKYFTCGWVVRPRDERTAAIVETMTTNAGGCGATAEEAARNFCRAIREGFARGWS